MYESPIAYKQPVRSNSYAQLTKTLQKHEDVHFHFVLEVEVLTKIQEQFKRIIIQVKCKTIVFSTRFTRYKHANSI